VPATRRAHETRSVRVCVRTCFVQKQTCAVVPAIRRAQEMRDVLVFVRARARGDVASRKKCVA